MANFFFFFFLAGIYLISILSNLICKGFGINFSNVGFKSTVSNLLSLPRLVPQSHDDIVFSVGIILS